MPRFLLSLFLALSASNVHAAEMPDSVAAGLQQAQTRLLLFRQAHETDSVIACQSRIIAIYSDHLPRQAEADDKLQRQTNDIVAIELFFLLVLAVVTAVYATSVIVRKRLKSHYNFELHKFEFDTYSEVIRSQKELLDATASAALPEVRSQVEERLHKAAEAIDELRQQLPAEELSGILVAQAQGLSPVRRMLDASESDTMPAPAAWADLRDALETVNPDAVSYLESRRPSMLTDDYRMCLLVLAGIPPKHMVRLLCCTPQKISMQRKRYLQTFFGRDGRPAEFDTLLRTSKGQKG